MPYKKSGIIIFGIICIVLGLNTDGSNFIPSFFKYIIGACFVLYSLIFVKKNIDEDNKEDNLN